MLIISLVHIATNYIIQLEKNNADMQARLSELDAEIARLRAANETISLSAGLTPSSGMTGTPAPEGTPGPTTHSLTSIKGQEPPSEESSPSASVAPSEVGFWLLSLTLSLALDIAPFLLLLDIFTCTTQLIFIFLPLTAILTIIFFHLCMLPTLPFFLRFLDSRQDYMAIIIDGDRASSQDELSTEELISLNMFCAERTNNKPSLPLDSSRSIDRPTSVKTWMRLDVSSTLTQDMSPR
jgi:hypothetical protein